MNHKSGCDCGMAKTPTVKRGNRFGKIMSLGKIEKGVALPPRQQISELDQHIRPMQVGDSFAIETDAIGNELRLFSYRWIARVRHSAKKLKIKVTVRCGDGGIRVWRIK